VLTHSNKIIEAVMGLEGEGRGRKGKLKGEGEWARFTNVILEGSELANHSLELHLPLLYLHSPPRTGISTKRARLEMFLLHLGLWVDGRCRLAPGTQDSFP